LALPVSLLAASCTSRAPEPVPVKRGVYVRLAGEETSTFYKWFSERTVNRQLRRLREAGGGELTFAPGTYRVLRGFIVPQVPNLSISGSPGTELVFMPEPATPLTVQAVLEGDHAIRVDRAEGLYPGWEYQLYAPDLDTTRVLEFRIEAIEGNDLILSEPVKFLPRQDSIPVGSRVLVTSNFFKVLGSPGLVIENLILDGRGRGDVRGHTLYGGVYATGLLQHARPEVHGLTIRNCTFRGLKGRGVAVYGLADVLVEHCEFHDITAQAIEIDHYSSGRVADNLVDGAEVGVMLNDCFETVVEDNELRNCLTAVRLLRIFDEEWINVGNVVRHNRIGRGNRRGVVFEDEVSSGLCGNYVLENHFIGQGPKSRVIDAEGNTVEGNTSEP
jgi:hypothetical protein